MFIPINQVKSPKPSQSLSILSADQIGERNREGGTQTTQLAAHYSRLAADQGSGEGQRMYAKCLVYGDSFVLNAEEAMRCFRLACSQNNSSAQMDYGIA
jgi:TPR repeat protein